MSFFTRLGILLRADAHGMVDALEDDRLLLRQHLRDAEHALAAKKDRLDLLDSEWKELERWSERLEERRAELERDVDLALQLDREELARFSAQQLLQLKHRVTEAEERKIQVAEERDELANLVREQGEQLEELRLRARAWEDRESSTGSPFGRGSSVHRVTEEDVELELLRRRASKAEPASDPDGPNSRESESTEAAP